jgi:hypothetical protein
MNLQELAQKTIEVEMLRKAFNACTPYDCHSRSIFAVFYPGGPWEPVNPEGIPMEKVARVMWLCMGHVDYLERFVGFFATEQVADYDLLKEFFIQALVRT